MTNLCDCVKRRQSSTPLARALQGSETIGHGDRDDSGRSV